MRLLTFTSLLLSLAVISLSSCASYRSPLHSSSNWKAFRESKHQSKLEDVSIVTGERQLGFDHRIHVPLPVGGSYIGSLIAEDTSVVQVDFNWEKRTTYLTGLKPGKTRMYLVNGFGSHDIDDAIYEQAPSYLLHVLPSVE